MNFKTSYQTKGVCGSNCCRWATASNTVGTPIHQDVAAQSVRTHQMSENITPRDMMVDQLIFALIDAIRQLLLVKSAQQRIHLAFVRKQLDDNDGAAEG